MPTFDTPAPVRVVLNLMFGQVRIAASDRAETTVEAYPRDSDDQDDVQAAEQLRIEYADGWLLVNVPEPGGSGGAVIVVIAVPTGSSLHGRGMAADFLAVGELGECQLSTGLGRIGLDRTGSLQLTSSLGDITVGRAAGSVEATANRGNVHLRQVEGWATIRAMGDGDATVGKVRGVARMHTEKGAIRISRAHTDVEARTTQGGIDIGEVARGTVVAVTTFGNIRIGVAETTSARLSLDSAAGTVYTSLALLAAWEQADEFVRVQARTVIGDVVVERSCAE
ncbi:hypothetical protein J2Z21_001238 [Streptomyces griseochromogenes]|uniref:DUF4097 domain-containing protein n=1 Tax=Streptomyces griseochromogenes TaxID=68214 RepID=A0A1B1AU08_9ACTN|nr:DUF4097 family beta strand repeat-containing protein [Streptomyces griseochromogenes]ANP50069.1 hypothetical protein AVL59_11000 [Streptomyces griseochromogenes]MBP2048314.1 hypothetical protein [Streptomyces griseochromogenes]